jgi:hypothetical protein
VSQFSEVIDVLALTLVLVVNDIDVGLETTEVIRDTDDTARRDPEDPALGRRPVSGVTGDTSEIQLVDHGSGIRGRRGRERIVVDDSDHA